MVLAHNLFKDIWWFKKNKKIKAKDESRPLIHSYYKFVKFNNMNIDEAPLLMQLSDAIKDSNKKGKIAFEASSFLSLHTSEIYKKFHSKFIILLRAISSLVLATNFK